MIFLFSLISHEPAQATEVCGQEICPSFVNSFEGAFGYYDAITWCAYDQCNPNLKETGEYGCYFGSPELDGSLSGATNWSYLKRPNNPQSAMGNGTVPNCNMIWRNYDKNIFRLQDREIVLEFQHPCDKEKVGCQLTISAVGGKFSKVEKNTDLRELKSGKERGMQNPAAAFVKGRKHTKKSQGNKSGNNPNGNLNGNTKVTGEENKTLLGTGNIDAAFTGASRIPTNAGEPTPNYLKKKACEAGWLDPGPKLHYKKLNVGKDYHYKYSGNKNIGNKGFECVGVSNIIEGSILDLCQPVPQSMFTFSLLKDGRKGCVGIVQDERVVILEADPMEGKTVSVADPVTPATLGTANPDSKACKVAALLNSFYEATKSKASHTSFTCKELAPECMQYFKAASAKSEAELIAKGSSPEKAKADAMIDQLKIYQYASDLARVDCQAGR